MGWNKLPLTSKVSLEEDTEWDELRAAIVERQNEVGGSPPPTVDADNLVLATTLNAYRQAVEALIPSFYHADGVNDGEAWTKATCLTAALGQADWTDPAISASSRTPRKAVHLNELRLVLNKLTWLRINPDAATRETYTGTSDYHAAWADAWAEAKAIAAAAGWGADASSRAMP